MALDVLSTIDLDLLSPRLVTVHGKQYDNSTRKITAQLWNGDSKWTAPSGVLGVISYLKPDGNVGFYDETDLGEQAVTFNSSDRSIITLILSTQSLTCDGSVKMEVNFYEPSRSRRLSTFSFILQVERSTITDDDLHSSSEFRILAEEIQQILDAVGSIAGITASGRALAPNTTPTVTVTGGSGRQDPYNIEFGIPKFTGITASKTALAPGSTPTVTVSGGNTASTPYNLAFGIPAFPGVTATASKLAQGSNPTVNVTGGTTATTPYNLAFGIPAGAGITNIAYSYGTNMSQTTPPTTWETNIADVSVAEGGWLWQKAVVTFGDGQTETYYMKGKQGPMGPTGVAVQDTEPEGSYLVWIDPDEAQTIVIPDIKDNVVALDSTYSSSKIQSLVNGKTEINDSTASTTSTYSSSKIQSLVSGKTEINDNTASTTSTYSSTKIENLISSGAAMTEIVAPAYTQTSSFPVGSYVIYNGQLYRAKVYVSSGSAFDSSKWEYTGGTGYELRDCYEMIARQYVSGKFYLLGEHVLYNNVLYVCTTEHSSATFDTTKWESLYCLMDSIESIVDDLALRFQSGTVYPKGTYVIYDYGTGPMLYRCTANESSTTWVGSEWTSTKLGTEIQSAIASASSGSGAVKYSEAQSLTEAQQQQVYANLGFPNNTLAKLSYTVVS